MWSLDQFKTWLNKHKQQKEDAETEVISTKSTPTSGQSEIREKIEEVEDVWDKKLLP